MLEAIATSFVIGVYVLGTIITWRSEPKTARERNEFDALRND